VKEVRVLRLSAAGYKAPKTIGSENYKFWGMEARSSVG